LTGQQFLGRLVADFDIESNVLMTFVFGILPKRHAQSRSRESLTSQIDHCI
jgi:hypothetical protein